MLVASDSIASENGDEDDYASDNDNDDDDNDEDDNSGDGALPVLDRSQYRGVLCRHSQPCKGHANRNVYMSCNQTPGDTPMQGLR